MTEKEVINSIKRCIKKGKMEYQYSASSDKDKDGSFSFDMDGFFIIHIEHEPYYTPYWAEDFRRIIWGTSLDKEDINYLEFHFINGDLFHLEEDGELSYYHQDHYYSSNAKEVLEEEYQLVKKDRDRINLILNNLEGLENEIINITCMNQNNTHIETYLNSEGFIDKVDALEIETNTLIERIMPLFIKQKVLFCYASVCFSVFPLVQEYAVSRYFRVENVAKLLVHYDMLWEFVKYFREERINIEDKRDIEQTIGQIFTVVKSVNK